jgi:hypothetical protein
MKGERLAWGLFVGLGLLYLAGFLLGWGERAPWHLLLVLVTIVGLYAVFSRRSQGR